MKADHPDATVTDINQRLGKISKDLPKKEKDELKENAANESKQSAEKSKVIVVKSLLPSPY